MYEYVEGRITSRRAARVIVDVAGVGYDLAVPIGALFAESDPVRVWTHLVVRDDAHLLYGFPDREMRELFRLLLSVRGVGPGLALGVLSGLSREELIAAIVSDDVKRLTKLKGVGKKTAEQILLDLRDKAPAWQDAAELETSGAKTGQVETPLDENLQDAIAALQSVGYSAKDAEKAVLKAAQDHDPNDLQKLVRAALRT